MATNVKFQDLAASEEESGLARSREQRKNAGNKMSRLLSDVLEEDDFYKTALGGFEEESGDEEYVSEAEESDQVDSDFSISETDEIVEQDEDDREGKRKRKKTLYKEPKRVKLAGKETTSKEKEKAARQVKVKTSTRLWTSYERRKSSRALTVESSAMHRKRMEGTKMPSKKKVKFSQTRRLTQKELLAEAEITEELNIESLKAYQQMEESKKKTKTITAVRKEPMIRYLSVAMPLIEANDDNEINVEDDGNENETRICKDKGGRTETARCARNFIIFTDPKTFPGDYFGTKKVSMPQKAYCPVTGLPAKYRDPVTGLPYATAQAFRYIREHYSKQATEAVEKQEGRQRSSRRISQKT